MPTAATGRRRDDLLRRVDLVDAALEDRESRLVAAVARTMDAVDSYVAANREYAEVHSGLDGREMLSCSAEQAARLRPLFRVLGRELGVVLDVDPAHAPACVARARAELAKHTED